MENKSLIVYYSCTGNTKRIAELIKEKTRADIFEIELKKDYSVVSAYTIGLVHASTGHMPQMKNSIDIKDYDTIILGTPVWMFTIAPALRTFINNNSFEGKKVIPFCTDEGGKGNCFEKIKELCEGAEISDSKEFVFVKNKKDEELKNQIDEWLNNLEK